MASPADLILNSLGSTSNQSSQPSDTSIYGENNLLLNQAPYAPTVLPSNPAVIQDKLSKIDGAAYVAAQEMGDMSSINADTREIADNSREYLIAKYGDQADALINKFREGANQYIASTKVQRSIPETLADTTKDVATALPSLLVTGATGVTAAAEGLANAVTGRDDRYLTNAAAYISDKVNNFFTDNLSSDSRVAQRIAEDTRARVRSDINEKKYEEDLKSGKGFGVSTLGYFGRGIINGAVGAFDGGSKSLETMANLVGMMGAFKLADMGVTFGVKYLPSFMQNLTGKIGTAAILNAAVVGGEGVENAVRELQSLTDAELLSVDVAADTYNNFKAQGMSDADAIRATRNQIENRIYNTAEAAGVVAGGITGKAFEGMMKQPFKLFKGENLIQRGLKEGGEEIVETLPTPATNYAYQQNVDSNRSVFQGYGEEVGASGAGGFVAGGVAPVPNTILGRYKKNKKIKQQKEAINNIAESSDESLGSAFEESANKIQEAINNNSTDEGIERAYSELNAENVDQGLRKIIKDVNAEGSTVDEETKKFVNSQVLPQDEVNALKEAGVIDKDKEIKSLTTVDALQRIYTKLNNNEDEQDESKKLSDEQLDNLDSLAQSLRKRISFDSELEDKNLQNSLSTISEWANGTWDPHIGDTIQKSVERTRAKFFNQHNDEDVKKILSLINDTSTDDVIDLNSDNPQVKKFNDTINLAIRSIGKLESFSLDPSDENTTNKGTSNKLTEVEQFLDNINQAVKHSKVRLNKDTIQTLSHADTARSILKSFDNFRKVIATDFSDNLAMTDNMKAVMNQKIGNGVSGTPSTTQGTKDASVKHINRMLNAILSGNKSAYEKARSSYSEFINTQKTKLVNLQNGYSIVANQRKQQIDKKPYIINGLTINPNNLDSVRVLGSLMAHELAFMMNTYNALEASANGNNAQLQTLGNLSARAVRGIRQDADNPRPYVSLKIFGNRARDVAALLSGKKYKTTMLDNKARLALAGSLTLASQIVPRHKEHLTDLTLNSNLVSDEAREQASTKQEPTAPNNEEDITNIEDLLIPTDTQVEVEAEEVQPDDIKVTSEVLDDDVFLSFEGEADVDATGNIDSSESAKEGTPEDIQDTTRTTPEESTATSNEEIDEEPDKELISYIFSGRTESYSIDNQDEYARRVQYPKIHTKDLNVIEEAPSYSNIQDKSLELINSLFTPSSTDSTLINNAVNLNTAIEGTSAVEEVNRNTSKENKNIDALNTALGKPVLGEEYSNSVGSRVMSNFLSKFASKPVDKIKSLWRKSEDKSINSLAESKNLTEKDRKQIARLRNIKVTDKNDNDVTIKDFLEKQLNENLGKWWISFKNKHKYTIIDPYKSSQTTPEEKANLKEQFITELNLEAQKGKIPALFLLKATSKGDLELGGDTIPFKINDTLLEVASLALLQQLYVSRNSMSKGINFNENAWQEADLSMLPRNVSFDKLQESYENTVNFSDFVNNAANTFMKYMDIEGAYTTTEKQGKGAIITAMGTLTTLLHGKGKGIFSISTAVNPVTLHQGMQVSEEYRIKFYVDNEDFADNSSERNFYAIDNMFGITDDRGINIGDEGRKHIEEQEKEAKILHKGKSQVDERTQKALKQREDVGYSIVKPRYHLFSKVFGVNNLCKLFTGHTREEVELYRKAVEEQNKEGTYPNDFPKASREQRLNLALKFNKQYALKLDSTQNQTVLGMEHVDEVLAAQTDAYNKDHNTDKPLTPEEFLEKVPEEEQAKYAQHYSFQITVATRFQATNAKVSPISNKYVRETLSGFKPVLIAKDKLSANGYFDASNFSVTSENKDVITHSTWLLALAQASGEKIFQSPKKSVESFLKNLQVFEDALGNAKDEIYNALANASNTSEALSANNIEILQKALNKAGFDITELMLNGLYEIARAKLGMDVYSNMYLEIDSRSSGPANISMRMPVGEFIPKDIQVSSSAGFYMNHIGDTPTLRDLYSEYKDDLYENAALNFFTIYNKFKKEYFTEDEKGIGKDRETPIYRGTKTLADRLETLLKVFIPQNLKLDEKGNITGFKRNFIKNPATQNTYGAGVNSLSSALINNPYGSVETAIVEKFSDILENLRNSNKVFLASNAEGHEKTAHDDMIEYVASQFFPELELNDAVEQFKSAMRAIKDLSCAVTRLTKKGQNYRLVIDDYRGNNNPVEFFTEPSKETNSDKLKERLIDLLTNYALTPSQQYRFDNNIRNLMGEAADQAVKANTPESVQRTKQQVIGLWNGLGNVLTYFRAIAECATKQAYSERDSTLSQAQMDYLNRSKLGSAMSAIGINFGAEGTSKIDFDRTKKNSNKTNAIAEIPFDRNRKAIKIYGNSYRAFEGSGVAIQPLLVQGSGDAEIIISLCNKLGKLNQTVEMIFDGINIPVDADIHTISQMIADSVYESTKQNLYAQMLDCLNDFTDLLNSNPALLDSSNPLSLTGTTGQIIGYSLLANLSVLDPSIQLSEGPLGKLNRVLERLNDGSKEDLDPSDFINCYNEIVRSFRAKALMQQARIACIHGLPKNRKDFNTIRTDYEVDENSQRLPISINNMDTLGYSNSTHFPTNIKLEGMSESLTIDQWNNLNEDTKKAYMKQVYDNNLAILEEAGCFGENSAKTLKIDGIKPKSTVEPITETTSSIVDKALAKTKDTGIAALWNNTVIPLMKAMNIKLNSIKIVKYSDIRDLQENNKELYNKLREQFPDEKLKDKSITEDVLNDILGTVAGFHTGDTIYINTNHGESLEQTILHEIAHVPLDKALKVGLEVDDDIVKNVTEVSKVACKTFAQGLTDTTAKFLYKIINTYTTSIKNTAGIQMNTEEVLPNLLTALSSIDDENKLIKLGKDLQIIGRDTKKPDDNLKNTVKEVAGVLNEILLYIQNGNVDLGDIKNEASVQSIYSALINSSSTNLHVLNEMLAYAYSSPFLARYLANISSGLNKESYDQKRIENASIFAREVIREKAKTPQKAGTFINFIFNVLRRIRKSLDNFISDMRNIVGIGSTPNVSNLFGSLMADTYGLVNSFELKKGVKFNTTADTASNTINPRIEPSAKYYEVSQKLKKKVTDYISKYGNTDTRVLNKRDQAYHYREHVLEESIKHGFHLSENQKEAFRWIYSATALGINGGSKESQRLRIVAHKAISLMRGDTFTAEDRRNNPNETALGLEKFRFLHGYYNTQSTTDAEKNIELESRIVPTLVAMAYVDPQVGKLLGSISFDSSAKYSSENSVEQAIVRTAETVFDKIDSTIEKLTNSYNRTGRDLLNGYINSIIDADAKAGIVYDAATSTGKILNSLNKGVDVLDKQVSKLQKKAGKKLDKWAEEKSAGKKVRTLSTLAQVVYAIIHKYDSIEGSGQYTRSERLLALSYTLPDGIVSTFIRSFLSAYTNRTRITDDFFAKCKVAKEGTDRISKQYRVKVPQLLKENLKIKPDDWVALTKVVGKTGLTALNSYRANMDNFSQLITADDKIIEVEVSKKINAINAIVPNLYLSRIEDYADVLGNYMATGKWKPSTIPMAANILRNSDIIVHQFTNRMNLRPEQIDDIRMLVDEVIALKALKHTDKEYRERTAAIMANPETREGFLTLFDTMAQREEADRKILIAHGQLFNRWQGYIPRIQEDSTSVVMIKNSDKATQNRYKLLGYRESAEYNVSHADPIKHGAHFWVADYNPEATFTAGGLRNLNFTAGGINLVSGVSHDNICEAIFDSQAVAYISSHMNDNDNNVLVPIYDRMGNIKGYERTNTQEPDFGKKYNEDFANILGEWQGRQVAESKLRESQEQVLQSLKDLYQKDKFNKYLDNYVNIFDEKVYEKDPVLKEAVMKFRNNTIFMQALNNIWGDYALTGKDGKTIPVCMVRKDLMSQVVGQRRASIADIWTDKSRFSEPTMKALRSTLNVLSFGSPKYLIKAEKLVQKGIATLKHNIVVRGVQVCQDNAIANMIQLNMLGIPTSSIIAKVPKIVRECENYVNWSNEMIELETKLSSKTLASTDQIKAQIAAIKSSIESLDIYPLIARGEFNTIEDVGGISKEDKRILEGNLGDVLEDKFEELPEAVKKGLKQAVVSKDTALYQFLRKATQYGDFVAKVILYEDVLYRQNKSEAEAAYQASTFFVDYDVMPSRTRDYLESIGLLWFYNFKLRISKVMMHMVANNPVRALLFAAGPQATGLPALDTPIRDSFIGRLLGFGPNLLHTAVIGAPGMVMNGILANPWLLLIGIIF